MQIILVVRGLIALSIQTDGKRAGVDVELPDGTRVKGFATTTGIVKTPNRSPSDTCTVECWLEYLGNGRSIVGNYSQNRRIGSFVHGQFLNAQLSEMLQGVLAQSHNLFANTKPVEVHT